MALDPAIAERLKRDANGLFAAVVQERATGRVLMMAWMDDEALARTLEVDIARRVLDFTAAEVRRRRS